MRRLNSLIFSGFLLLYLSGSAAAFTEPNMTDYTAIPQFINKSVPPNIMIILDNSGSMNHNAYGPAPADDALVTGGPFEGEPYSDAKIFPLVANADDAEEPNGGGTAWLDGEQDLDFADSTVGLRFQNIAVPQGTLIKEAYIEFIADENHSGASNLTIVGEAIDNAPVFAATNNNIIGRTPTAATVAWVPDPWTAGDDYSTSDIKTIVQEIVNRPGWVSGNAMVFWVTGTGKRAAESRESGANVAARLRIIYDNPGTKRYYGYFNPDFFYNYSSNKFNLIYKKVAYDYSSGRWNAQTLAGTATTLDNARIVSEQLWDGNWMNWLCMRRLDVLRKVLMGGKATARTGGGNQVNYGEVPAQTNRRFRKAFDSSTLSAVSPFHGNYTYRMLSGNIEVVGTGNTYNIRIQKDKNYEPSDFTEDGNLSGVLQRVGNRARWGNIWFNSGTGSGNSGGTVEHVIGTNMTTLITDLQNTGADTWTPLAETFYVAMQYFRQQDPAGGLDYPNNAVPHANAGQDPFYNGTEYLWCPTNFILLLTDGASTKDSKIPNEFKDYDGDGNDSTACNEASNSNCDYPDGGSDYLDDLALYARTVDLRSDLQDDQNLLLYAVYAFGSDPNAQRLLKDAAKNGGFDDKNQNGIPDQVSEWDENSDGIPDTYYEANDGYALEAKLMEAILSMTKRASSGTSASVLATNSEGEGNMIQAYFMPEKSDDAELHTAKWLGYLQSLWVDDHGNLHEDTNQNQKFEPASDQVITFVNDGQTTKFIRGSDPVAKDLEELLPIFEAGKLLADRAGNPRKIFTFIDKDKDSVVDDGAYDPLDNSGEVIAFTGSNEPVIRPYLGVRDDIKWGNSGAKLGVNHQNRGDNIISWVRGTDVSGLRSRTLDGVTWPLGDIVNSTPVTVAKPPEQFHIWYGDKSYKPYFDAYKDREAVVYVGGNDGMLHAFTHGRYNKEDKQYLPGGTERIGDELWAFIPQSVLPHLKWVTQQNYTHTYMVDAKPRVFDAKILPDDTHYADSDGDDNWGTILVMGLNMGAKMIGVNEDFGSGVEERTFNPSYICMDITEPRNPRLLWERAYPDQAMSYSIPEPVKVGNSWFLVFGSGPTDYDGTSTQAGYVYVVDMKSGNMLKKYGPLDTRAFFGSGVAYDKGINYNVDAVYIGNAYESGSWKGSVYKLAIPCTNCQWESDYDPSNDFGYNSNPDDWKFHKLFDSDRPITGPPMVSTEFYPDLNVDNVWIYFGTGRYLNDTDKSSTESQYLYGIKDPFFNIRYEASLMHDYNAATGKTLSRADLFRGDTITVTTAGHVLQGGSLFGTGDLNSVVNVVRSNYDGWYHPLETHGTAASERCISRPSVIGGITFFPAFTPNEGACGQNGDTNFYGLYYLTGTAYTKQIFDVVATQISVTVNGNTNTEDVVAVKAQKALKGSPPPSAGIHAGAEKGGKAYLQMSTGEVVEIKFQTAIYFQSTITDWWDRLEQP